MFTNSKLAKAIRLAVVCGAASALAPTAALAQEETADGAEKSVERVSVIGSRIRRADFAANAPVASISAEQFELNATFNTEQLLNQLPQIIPGLDRTSNNPGDGTASIDLRGLGSNRTLVLVNGRRAVPTGRGGVVDINSIPTALIKNVEILTGGASAVYGSDAVAGVVNFELKNDFEGVQISSGYKESFEGDAGLFNVDFTLGGNFDDGKGNVVFNMSFTDRADVFQGDRDFSENALFDIRPDGLPPSGLEPGGSTGVPATAIFNGAFSAFSPDSQAIIFGQDGSIRPFIGTGAGNDNYNYAPVNYFQLPQERHQATVLGTYEVSNNLELYGQVMFSESRVPSQLAPTPIFEGTNFTLDGNPFITPGAQQILSDALGNDVDTDGDGIADEFTGGLLRRRLEEIGPRRSEDAFTNYQFSVGARGNIADSDWFYDVFYQTGKSANANAQLGNINRGRFNQALLLETDDAGQVVLDANGAPSCADTGSNGSTSACVPLNIFGEGNITQAAGDFLTTAVSSTALFEQKIWGASVTGDTSQWFELQGGAVGVAVGYENRNEAFEFLPSQDLAASTIAGFNGAPPIQGGFSVASYFVEVDLPILDGVKFADKLDLQLAYRSEDYSTSGTVDAFKISGSWAPVDNFRIRAGFNTAVRAPNIGELFAPRGEGFPSAADPCAGNGPAALQTPETRAICLATGVPENAVFGNGINPASGQVRSLAGGNPNLVPEEAETLTLGFVYEVSEDLTVAVDYFDIQIDDAVAPFGGGTSNVLATCYDPSLAGSGVGGQFCNSVNRFADGSIDFVEGADQNVGSINQTGYDIIVGYNIEAFGGDIALDYLGTFTDQQDTLPFEGGQLIECAGNFGNNCGQPIPEYKHRATINYSADEFTLQLAWRHVGRVNDDDDTRAYFVESIGGFNYFEAAGTYFISDNYRVTAGIENLFDKAPPVLGENDQQGNTWPATYDVFGRTGFVNFTAEF
jgi:iron complex outermembrane receptor protein